MMDAITIGAFATLLLCFNGRIMRSPMTGFGIWMIFLLINDILNYNPSIHLGVNIMLQDIVFCYFMCAGILRFRRSGFASDTTLKWFTAMLFFIIISIPVFVLLKGHGLIRSINVSRGFILFPPAFIYFFSFKYASEDIDQILKWFVNIALVSAIIVFALQLFSKERVVPSSGALFFAFAAIMTYIKFLENGKPADLLAGLFLLLLVVFLRHRSVWIALGLSLVFIHFYIKLTPRMVTVILVMIVGLVCAAVIFPKKAQELTGKIIESASPFKSSDDFENSTGGGRVARWTAQLESKFEWPVLLWGLGPAYERKVYMNLPGGEKRLSTASFHNHYLEQMFRIGGISVLIFLIFITRLLRINHDLQSSERNFQNIGLCACIFGTLGFGMMYSFTFLLFIFLGITYSILTMNHENSSDHTDIQQAKGAKRLALDAWKHEHA